MSKTIDQRVVEMRFDNKHFESNVQTTLSTLDKLKQKLHLSEASKGLSGLNRAANNVNMSGLSGAIDTVNTKFSAMQVMGVTALANITNSAVNAGKRMISALTIDPVKTGFQEYETQINSVQTILANTSHAGTTIEDVNKALDQLNTYADETIYNFTEMTRNIGTFTAAGVDLETSVASIKGIANLAAVSGSTSQQASTAMYQLSQALAAGKVSLMDWNSVVNAGMGGKVFQDALVRTSELLGTGAQSAIDMYGSFRESLTKGEWLTTEVLTETLQQFAGAYSKADLIAQGFTESQAEEITKMAETAKSAATDVKTFTQLWDVMKESAQSGWSQTWKLLIGDMEGAKALLSPIAEFFTGEDGIITKMSNFRNKLLEGAMSNPFADMIDKVSKVKGATEEVTKAMTDFGDIVDRVIGGEFGNGQSRWDKLTEAGYDWAHVQNLVNEKLGDSTRHATNYKEAQEGVTESQIKNLEQLAQMDVQQLRRLGLTHSEIKALKLLQEQSEKTGIPLGEIIEDSSKLEGRSLLINSFKNAASGLVGVFTAMKNAWVDIFPPMTSDQLYNIIAALHKMSLGLRLTDAETGELTETAKKFQRIFKGVFAIIDIVATITGGALKMAFKIVSGLFKEFGIDALDAAAAIADNVVAFRDWINESFGISEAIDALVKLLARGIKVVAEWFKSFKQSETFKNIIRYFNDTGKAIRDWITGIKEAENIPKYIIDGLILGFTNGISRVWNAAVEIGKTIVQAIKDFLGIHSPSTVFIAIGGFIIAGLVMGLLNGMPDVGGAFGEIISKVTGFVKNIDWGALFAAGISTGLTVGVLKIADAFSALVSPIEGIGDLLSGAGEVLEKSAKPIAKVIKSTAKVVKSFANVMNSIAFKKNTEGVRNLAISLAILVGAVALLTYVDTNKLWNAVGVVAVLATILGILSVLVNKINESSIELDKGGLKVNGLTNGLIGIAGAILMLAIVMKLVGSMDGDSLKQGLLSVAGIAAGMLLFMLALTGISNIPGKSIKHVGSNLLKIAGAIAVLAIVAKLMSGMTWGELDRAKEGLGALIGCVALLMLIGMIPGKNVGKLGTNLIKISGAIAILAIVAKIMGGMTWGEIGKATVGIGMLIGCIALLSLIGMIPSKRLRTLGSNILMVSGAIAVLAVTAKLIATMKWSDMGKAAVGIIALAGIISGLIAATRLASDKDLTRVGSTILMVSVAIGILAAVATLLGFLNLEHLAKGVLAVGVLASFMAGLIFVTKYAQDCKANLIVMTVAIGVMAAAVTALSFIDTNKLMAASGAMALLMGVFALMVMASGKASASMGSLIVMTVAVGLLGVLLVALTELRDPESLIGTASAISILLLAISGALFIVSKAGPAAASAIGSMMLMGLVVAELGIILGVMSSLNAEASIQTVTAISILLGVMAGVLVLISNVGKTSVGAVGAMALMGLVVGELAIILGVMSALNAEPSVITAVSLSILLGVMAGVLLLVSNIGKTSVGAVGAMLLMGLVVGELAIILGLMSKFDVNPSIETAGALSILLVSMSGALVLLGVVGAMGPAAFIGIGALATLIAGIGGLIIGIGALMDKFPMLEDFLNNGIPVVEKIGYAIGSFFGNIVGGFIGNLTSGLPDMATDLSTFMTNLQPFIEGAKNISSDVIAGVGYLSGAILALTLADLVQGLGSFLTLGSSFSDLGAELSGFMTNAMPFIAGAATVNPEMLTGVRALADTILILTAANVLEGLTAWFTGGSSLASFGAQLPQLGSDLSAFANNLGSFDETKVASITCATNAIKALASAAETLPNEGGLWAKIAGDNSIATFGSYLPDLASNLNGFATNLGSFDETKVTTITCAANAIKAIAAAADTLPNEGGWASKILGDNSIATFSSYLPELGTNLNGFATNLGTFGEDTVTTITSAGNAIKALATAADTIPNEGGLWSSIVGDNSLATFGSSLPGLGTNLSSFATNLGTFNESTVTTVKCAGDAIVALGNASKNIDGQADWAKKIFGDNSLSSFSKQFGTLGTNLSAFVKNLGTFTDTQVATVRSAVSAINAFSNLADADLKGAKKNLDGFGDEIVELATDVSDFVVDMPESSKITTAITNIEKILSMIKDISGADTKIATDFTNSLKEMGKAGVKAFVEAFTSASAKEDVKKAGIDLMKQIVKGVEDELDSTKKAFKSAASKGAAGAKESKQDFYDAGSHLVSGFASGISENSYKATAKAKAMAEAAAEAAKKALKINSPSKVFMAIGSSIPEGFVKGMNQLGSAIEDSAASMGETAINGIGKSITRISDVVNTDIDSQPTIRPVLDLTDVRSGANSINSLFNTGTSIGVMGRISAISSAMNNHNQNGSDVEVVSAINKLRKELGNVHGDTYQINGISYDGESDVANAIKTITKAAIRERRT